MDEPPWSSIEYHEPRKPYRTSSHPWTGYDTETCRGDVRILCDSQGNVLTDPTVDETLRFLWRPKSRGVFYNLRFDSECIIKGLPRKNVHEILDDTETVYGRWTIKIVPKKLLVIGREPWEGQRIAWSNHYDAAQFYGTRLHEAAKRFLGEGKKGLSQRTVKALGSSRKAWQNIQIHRVINYCRRDAKLAKRLMEHAEKLWTKAGHDFCKPISPANVAARTMISKDYPFWNKDLHQTVGRAAYESYWGGRFEARVKGSGRYWRADIRSAYPNEMRNLPPSHVSWIGVEQESRALEYPWGFVLADVFWNPDSQWGPLPIRVPGGRLRFPSGRLGKRWMTLDEYRYVSSNPRTRFFKAIVAEDTGQRPLEYFADLFAKRDAKKRIGDPTEAVDKVFMNSGYGKTLERRKIKTARREPSEDDSFQEILVDEDGNPYVETTVKARHGALFNPIWASTITARVRLRMLHTALLHDTAMIATDGLILREAPSFKAGEGLGDWEITQAKQGVIVGNGMYEFYGEKAKRRGFGDPYRVFKWRQLLRSVPPRTTVLWDQWMRPLHPGEVLVSTKWDQTDIGCFKPFRKRIALNDNTKRVFPRMVAKDFLETQEIGRPYIGV